MKLQQRYLDAKQRYKALGVDVERALETLGKQNISMHCWQGDDVSGFDNDDALSGGIQVTGNHFGRARNFEELTADIDRAQSLIAGKHNLNLHASYAVFEDGFVDRDKLEPKHFQKWIDFARARGIGLDFNPTFFSHPKAAYFTLSSPDDAIRRFWIDHGRACLRIADAFARELDKPCTMNIWIPDGYKNPPADRLSPRARFKDSLDKILATPYDKNKVTVTLESKVFGIGLESYTVGSAEFCLNYAAQSDLLCLMDNGHYHPTELVSDKISAMLLFNDRIALHVTHPVRWDSDHVVRFDDETREIANEIVAADALDRVLLALDFFDGSINRVAAWVLGMRNMQKSLLYALLTPHDLLRTLQDKGDATRVLTIQEELKSYPFSDVWDAFCAENGVPLGADWYDAVKTYEDEVLRKRV